MVTFFSYDRELSRPNQLLNGEYGAWRTLGFHTEPCEFDPNGPWSEEHMSQILETKVRLAEKVRNRVCGHFLWLLSCHDNPGRRHQADEAYRLMDKVALSTIKGCSLHGMNQRMLIICISQTIQMRQRSLLCI